MLRPSPFLMRAPFRCSSKNPEIAVTNLCLQAAMARSLRLKLLLARRLVGSTMGVTRGKSLSLREAMAKAFNLPRAKAVTPRSKAAILEVRCGASIKGMLFRIAMRIQNAEMRLGSNREKIPILGDPAQRSRKPKARPFHHRVTETRRKKINWLPRRPVLHSV